MKIILNNFSWIYGYGFNGKDRQDEWSGAGNSYDFGARILDPRIGRWLSVDPLSGDFPNQSPFSFVYNNPLSFIDEDGKSGEGVIDHKNKEIVVKITLNTYGSKSSKALAKKMANDAEASLNAEIKNVMIKNEPYTVRYEIKGKRRTLIGTRIHMLGSRIFNSHKQNYARIENWDVKMGAGALARVDESNRPENFGGNSMYFPISFINTNTIDVNTVAHEITHGLGYSNTTTPYIPLVEDKSNPGTYTYGDPDIAHDSEGSESLMEGQNYSPTTEIKPQTQEQFQNLNLNSSDGRSMGEAIVNDKRTFVIGVGGRNRSQFIKKNGEYGKRNADK